MTKQREKDLWHFMTQEPPLSYEQARCCADGAEYGRKDLAMLVLDLDTCAPESVSAMERVRELCRAILKGDGT
jgi:hypothetical protein